MDIKELKAVLTRYHKASGQDCWLGEDQLIEHPCNNRWKDMIARNPTVATEVKKLNSSTALAINYFELFADVNYVPVDYEIAVAIPLILPKGKGHEAMLDVIMDGYDGVTYVESKFLEPYYSQTHEISPSYFIEKYYESSEVASKWIGLFKKVQEMIDTGKFKYYDINQMLKHLLAIYRTKPQESVELLNFIWKPTDIFYSYITSKRSVSSLQKRVNILTTEMTKAEELMNHFVKEELHWGNCSIGVSFYNDQAGALAEHQEFETFKRKYLL